MSKKFFILIFTFASLKIFAQKITITNIYEQNGKFIIKYNLEAPANQKFNISVNVWKNGSVFVPKNISGDLYNISNSYNNTIVWNYSADNFLVDNPVDFQLVATKISKNINYVKLSLICPGLGTYQYRGKPKFLRAAFVYGAYTLSLTFYFIGKSNYNKYLETTDFDQRISYLKKSKFWGYTALGFSLYATGLWAWDVFQAASTKKSNTAFFRRLQFYPSYDFCYNTAGLTVKLKF